MCLRNIFIESMYVENVDGAKIAAKGGRTSPVVRPPAAPRAPARPVPKAAEAMAVLVQHLVFNVEAYQVPALRKEVQKFRVEIEQVRQAHQHVEEVLDEERRQHVQAVEEERTKYDRLLREMEEQQQNQIIELHARHREDEQRLLQQFEDHKQQLCHQNDEKLLKLKLEFQKFQKMHEESIDILREENDSIREQIDEKLTLIDKAKMENAKLKEEYEARLHSAYKESNKLRVELVGRDEKADELVRAFKDENARLREENDRLLSYDDNNGISVQEVQSLRAVLELKQNEVGELRRALAEAAQRNEALAGVEERVAALGARCEDLQLQLQRKAEYEQQLLAENKRLIENNREEVNQRKRLSQHNEELQWKLQQNKEVMTKVIEQAGESAIHRTVLSSSFSERRGSPLGSAMALERRLSFRESPFKTAETRPADPMGPSPPASPKVKGVVEKSDSVSYVLDLDESPDVVASRIVRRSFRNSTPPKTAAATMAKSPSSKRPRIKNPLSLSASAGAIIPINSNSKKVEFPMRTRSSSVRNGQVECVSTAAAAAVDDHRTSHAGNPFNSWITSTPTVNVNGKSFHALDLDEENDDVDLNLPALPSEMGGRKSGMQALPCPKDLAGEAMISESNSEDESTSSSSVL